MSIIFNDNDIICKSCIYYESYHRYLNPMAVARHYCTKCNDEIYIYNHNLIFPKACYFNDYYEESEEHRREVARRYQVSELACQVED